MVRRALRRWAPPATPLPGQELAVSAQHGVCCGDPLPCLSVLIPHPAGAVWAPWPGAVSGCQGLLVLAVPRLTQHFFPEPLGNRLAVFSLPSRRVLALLGMDGWLWELGSLAGHRACLQRCRWQDGGSGQQRAPLPKTPRQDVGRRPHSTSLGPALVGTSRWDIRAVGPCPAPAAWSQWERGAGGCRLHCSRHSPAWHSEGTPARPVHPVGPLRVSRRELNAYLGAEKYGAGAPRLCLCPPGLSGCQASGGCSGWEAVNVQLIQ